MSLVSLPDVEKIPSISRDPLYIQNGIMMQPVFECEDLHDIRYTERKPEKMKSDFATICTFLANLEDIKLVWDARVDKNMWWGFMRGCGKLYVHHHAKHDRPTYFV